MSLVLVLSSEASCWASFNGIYIAESISLNTLIRNKASQSVNFDLISHAPEGDNSFTNNNF